MLHLSDGAKRFAFVVFCSVTVSLAAQQPAAPKFEVASIRQNVSGRSSSSVNSEGETFTATSRWLVELIQWAYETTAPQIVGGPDWVRSDRFDIVAKMAAGANRDQIDLMLRTLLEDRFNLRVRNEKREMAIFELALANKDGRVGPNLHDCSKLDEKEANRNRQFTGPPGGNVAAGGCGPMSRVASLAAGQVQGIVHDKTGLSGNWRFNVSYGPDLPDPASANPNLPSFVTALREQLGLKLERARALVDVVVIDSVDRPTPD
jgi:uncharacterized protein (TIGR03435 family)